MLRGLASSGLLLAALLTTGAVPAAPPPRPNIILILADDMGWGDVGAYGHQELQTPSLDTLATQGALFTQFYVNSAVCTPSRVGIMTGRFPSENRFHSVITGNSQTNERSGVPDWLDPSLPLVTRLMKDAGYATGLFGKWHLGQVAEAPTPGAYGIDDHRTLNSSPDSPGWVENSSFRADSTEFFVDESIRFIEDNQANGGQPFFLNLWTMLPHATLNPRPEQMDRYSHLAPPWPFPGVGTKQVYYASITAMDEQIGRLMTRLDELGLADNTIVIFTSDNGPEDIVISSAVHSGIGSTGPFRGRKRSLYEGGIRVPLIVRWPGKVTAGRVDDSSVISAVDFMPTFLSLAEGSLPEGFEADGEDITDILVDRSRPRSTPLYWEWRFKIFGDTIHRSPMAAMRDGDWKLLMNPDLSRVELYDIRNDPTELDNVAAENSSVVDQLTQSLLAWQSSLPEGPLHPHAGGNAFPWPACQPHSDSDGDGVVDCNDGCPSDPDKTSPGECGCNALESDEDRDGDGTRDCLDACPDDGDKVEPGACGCGLPDADTDGDGVADCTDPCPFDNPDDSDADGVCDSSDSCPGIDDGRDDDDDATPDCADNCPLTANPGQVDSDNDGAGDACDCAATDPATHPGAIEVNDGRDNQCGGEPGFGITDETSGISGFLDQANSRYSWPPQEGATLYEVARAEAPDFIACINVNRTAFWEDVDMPQPNNVFYYLNRPIAPNRGSWGQLSSGAERKMICDVD